MALANYFTSKGTFMSDLAENTSDNKDESGRYWKTQFYLFCGMVFLALVGMGVTQAVEQGAWEYWLFVVLVYASIGWWRSSKKAKQEGQPQKQLVARTLVHWMILLAFLSALMLLERREIITRDAASYVALMFLALSCCMAGVHFDWMLLVVGTVLTIMTVSLATLEQYMVVMWVVMIAVVMAAGTFVFFKSKALEREIVKSV
jgi:hypothetical protein